MPTNLSATPGTAQVALSWDAVSGAMSYTVYYSTSPISNLNAPGVRSVNVTGTGTTVPTMATIPNLPNGTLHYFVVTASNAGGNSPLSTEVSATPQVPAPGAPIVLSADAGNAQVTIRWMMVTGAMSYTVYYSTSPISDLTASIVRSVTATATSATVTGLTNGTPYHFKVTASNAGGESAASSENVSITPAIL